MDIESKPKTKRSKKIKKPDMDDYTYWDVCEGYILHYDHHWVLLGNWVGKQNYPQFIAFLIIGSFNLFVPNFMVKMYFSVMGYYHFGFRLFMVNTYAMLIAYLGVAWFILSVAIFVLMYTNVLDTIDYYEERMRKKNEKEADKFKRKDFLDQTKYVFSVYYDVNSITELLM